jgi:hypothetical protein
MATLPYDSSRSQIATNGVHTNCCKMKPTRSWLQECRWTGRSLSGRAANEAGSL